MEKTEVELKLEKESHANYVERLDNYIRRLIMDVENFEQDIVYHQRVITRTEESRRLVKEEICRSEERKTEYLKSLSI